MIRQVKKFRDCDLQFCFKDGCVFADFHYKKINGKEVLKLARISFDGFGCCQTVEKNCLMSAEDTTEVKRAIEHGGIVAHEAAMMDIMKRFFTQHKNVIWEDALERHGLI